MHAENYLDTDSYKDVENSIYVVFDALQKVEVNAAYWKVAVSFSYQALQGACVCMLTRPDSSGPFQKDDEKKLRHYLNLQSQKAICEAHNAPWELPDMEYPNCRLASLQELLKRLPSPHRAIIPKAHDAGTTEFENAIFALQEMRHTFSHFPPMSWSIEKAYMLEAIHIVLQKTKTIVSGAGYETQNRFHQTETENLLIKCIEITEKLLSISTQSPSPKAGT
jgi:hypothetical protein